MTNKLFRSPTVRLERSDRSVDLESGAGPFGQGRALNKNDAIFSRSFAPSIQSHKNPTAMLRTHPCYRDMLIRCINRRTCGRLLSTTLVGHWRCTGDITAPPLPSITTCIDCIWQLAKSCRSHTTARRTQRCFVGVSIH